jgi:hypothetical protein
MYKAQDTNTGEIFKSYEIMVVCDHVIKHPSETTQFYIGYKPYTKLEFLKLFLQECNDYKKYSRLYNAVFKEKQITELYERQEN